jgi:serpin B
MPYLGKDQAMVVLLPRKDDGLAGLEKTLTAEAVAGWVKGMREQKVEVFLPRFKLTSRSLLKEALTALGMKKAFTESEADFSGMNDGREPLFISAVTHQAFVETNEKGTEAAAATGAAVAGLAMPTGPVIPVFRADHPFVFAICDTRTGMILFLGRVVQP